MIARYKDLCIDAVDVHRQAAFWGTLLGLSVGRSGPPTRLTGSTPQHTVWLNAVPEPASVKARVHLDVRATDVQTALDLGATRAQEFEHWTVMTDPEGGEFCLFPRGEPRGLYEVVVDCAEPEPIARWWAEIFGGRARTDGQNPWWWVEGIGGLPFDCFVFAPVPEPKTVKNRVHWDVQTDRVSTLLAAGATLVRERGGDLDWTILADPDGNEFCAFTR